MLMSVMVPAGSERTQPTSKSLHFGAKLGAMLTSITCPCWRRFHVLNHSGSLIIYFYKTFRKLRALCSSEVFCENILKYLGNLVVINLG